MRTFTIVWVIVFCFWAFVTRSVIIREPEVAILGNMIITSILCLPFLFVRLVFQRVTGVAKPVIVAAALSLDQVLFNWTKTDVFTVRDLMESVAIFGRTGSGKTSGSGLAMARAVVQLPKSGGLIPVSKPTDREYWISRFKEAGRLDDLIIFGPNEAARCNFIDFELKSGGDSRSLTEFLMVTGEALSKGGKANNEKFWDLSKRRVIYNTIEMLRMAWGTVAIPAVQEFITTAAYGSEQLSKVKPEDGGSSPLEKFKQGLHFRTMIAAGENASTSIEMHDYKLCTDYWGEEFVQMDNKVRSSILADVMNVLHTYNTGVVREMVSTTTTVSPAVMEQGKWILLDFPLDEFGDSARIIMSGFKFLTQKFILRRHAQPGDSVIVLYLDEAQDLVSSFDAAFLAKCRSHYGCMVFLSQSTNGYIRGDK